MWSGPVFVFFIGQNRRTQLTHDLVCRMFTCSRYIDGILFSVYLSSSFTPYVIPWSPLLHRNPLWTHLSLYPLWCLSPPPLLSFAIHLMISLFFYRFTHTCPLRQSESGVTTSLVPRTAWVKQQQTLISVWNTFPRFLIQIWLFLPHQLCCGRLPITVQWVRRRVLVHVCLCASQLFRISISYYSSNNYSYWSPS